LGTDKGKIGKASNMRLVVSSPGEEGSRKERGENERFGFQFRLKCLVLANVLGIFTSIKEEKGKGKGKAKRRSNCGTKWEDWAMFRKLRRPSQDHFNRRWSSGNNEVPSKRRKRKERGYNVFGEVGLLDIFEDLTFVPVPGQVLSTSSRSDIKQRKMRETKQGEQRELR